MKKLFISFVTLFLIITTFSSCSQTKDTVNNTTDLNSPNDETISANETKTNKTEDKTTSNSSLQTPLFSNSGDYKGKIDINEYMKFIVNFFYTPYKTGDNIPDDLVLPFCMRTVWNAKNYLSFVETDENTMQMLIDGEKLRRIGKILISDNFELEKCHNNNEIVTYIDSLDVYSVNYGRGGNWGYNYCLNSSIPLQITETSDYITVIANVGFASNTIIIDPETEITLKYTFQKIVDQEFLFYRIVEIEEIK